MLRNYQWQIFTQQLMILVLDDVLLNLYNIFGDAFERALELYEQGRITYIFPSESAGVPPHNDKHTARYLVQVRGLSGAIYMLFPDINYCLCASFRYKIYNFSRYL